MVRAHSAAGWIVVAALLCFTVLAAMSALPADPPKWHAWLEAARKIVVALLAAQVGLGAVTLATGHRPSQTLHLLYGVVAAGVLPAANSFSSDAPPRARATVLTVGGVLTTLLVWRLFSTG